jgi:4-amino-4-deoxy-L-arabinose transferase-like glycosyltransferase
VGEPLRDDVEISRFDRLRRSMTQILPWIWVGLLCWIAFWHRLGDTGLLDEVEPLFVETARQMFVTGDWLTPMFNGAPRFDKPPLIYWLMGGSFGLFGVNEWAARLPVAVCGSAIVGAVFYLLHWLRRNQLTENLQYFAPYLGSAIVALNVQMVFFGRTGYSDMLLNACFAGSLIAFFLGYCQPETPVRQRLCYLLFFALMGLGVLTKGPVGAVLPGAIVFIFLLVTQNLGQMRWELPWKFGPLLWGAIAVPWYVLITLQQGDGFIKTFFGFHNVQRVTEVVNQHGGPWYYHFLVLLPGMLPWSIALPGAIWSALKQAKAKQRTEQLGLFALIWFIVVMGVFSIVATKYITYSLPAVPAAAILIALFWNQQREAKAGLGLRLLNYGTVGLFAVLAIGSWFYPNYLNDDTSMPNLGMAMVDAGLPWFGTILWGIGLLLGVLYLGSAAFWRVKILTSAAFILLFVTPAFAVLDQVRQLPLRQIAQGVWQEQQPNEPVAMGLKFFGKPSVVFYSQRPIALMNRSAHIRPYLDQLNREGVRSVLMVTTENALAEGGIQVSEYVLLRQVGIYQLIRVGLE